MGKPNAQKYENKNQDVEVEVDEEMTFTKVTFLKNKGEKVTTLGAMAKMYASETCVKIANDAVYSTNSDARKPMFSHHFS